MTVTEALAAADAAREMIDACESTDDLDRASNYNHCRRQCPKTFTPEQRDLTQQIVLRAYEHTIGRR